MKITWYGHSAFRVELRDAILLFDPFLTGNPVFPNGMSVDDVTSDVTHILLTHGHNDHVGDAVEIAKRTGAQVTSNYEICMWAGAQGVENLNPMGCGGTVDVGPFQVSLTQAHHSSSIDLEDAPRHYMGTPNGIVIRAEGEPTLYHMGDTDIFGDMALINELYQPKVGIVPIGDRFTMGARTAALACKRFFAFERIIPCHFGTFPILDQGAEKFLGEMGEESARVTVATPGGAFEV